jgi:phospholipid-binding lipoprotein MlaA
MKIVRFLAIALLAAFAAGCASDPETPNDPLEPVNRLVFGLNQRLDRNAALPAASFYSRNMPNQARRTFHNIISNLSAPVTVMNDMLQTEFENAGIAAGRFAVNTTLGVAGIFDVATDWGMPERNRDFGETLGSYGVGPGPYLILPFRGPTSVRDFGGSYVDGFFSPLRYVQYDGRQYIGIVKSSLGSVDNRSANIVTYRDIERASVDYYATMRAYYLQRRARQVEDKNVQIAELPDF